MGPIPEMDERSSRKLPPTIRPSRLRYDAINAWMAEQRRNPSGRNLGGRKVGWKLMVVGKYFKRIINNVPASLRIVV